MGLVYKVFDAVIAFLILVALVPILVQVGAEVDILRLLGQIVRLLF